MHTLPSPSFKQFLAALLLLCGVACDKKPSGNRIRQCSTGHPDLNAAQEYNACFTASL